MPSVVVWICSRCGKRSPDIVAGEARALAYWKLRQELNIPIGHVDRRDFWSKQWIDLCPDCSLAFRKWWRGEEGGQPTETQGSASSDQGAAARTPTTKDDPTTHDRRPTKQEGE